MGQARPCQMLCPVAPKPNLYELSIIEVNGNDVQVIKTMKNNFSLSMLIILISVATLLLPSVLRVYWQRGGPNLAYWVSEIILGGLGIFWGVILLIRVKNTNKKSISKLLGGLIILLVGIIVIINAIRFINLGCVAPGC